MTQKPKLEQADITISVDADILLELRKILFKKGISISRFMAFLMEKTTFGDPRCDELLELAVGDLEDIKAFGTRTSISREEELYLLIERGLEKKLQKNSGEE